MRCRDYSSSLEKIVPDITLVNAVFPSSVRVPPHGLLYVTASLIAAGFSVELRDYQQCPANLPPEEPASLARFAGCSSPVVGISCMSYALPLVIEAARQMKAERPDVVIVVGGIGPSPVAARLLVFCAAIDVVVVGEGEETAVDLFTHLQRGLPLSEVPGLVYRDGTGIHTTGPRQRIKNLTALPWPAYDQVDLKSYDIVDIQYGRGCPFSCSFCDIAPYWDRKHTHRAAEQFVDELEFLEQVHGVSDIFVIDDTFVLSKAQVTAICDEIVRRGLRVEWGCYARVDLVSESLLARMAEAGCRKVFFGIESGSDTVLLDIVKGATLDQSRVAVTTALRHMPFVTTSFVWGFPSESLEDLEDTAALVLYYAALGACPQLNLVVPYSYSPLFRQHRSTLTYDPRFSAQLQFYGGAGEGWVSEMIRRDTELFSVFYQVPTSRFAAKWEYLDEIGLNPHVLQGAFFDHPVGYSR
jgi:radical SAM superfamily enzyme YgiQ (UPF0313 family)